MTAKGTLTECIEDMEIEFEDGRNMIFISGVYYTSLLGEKIYVIDRSHQNIELNNNIFKKHFKIITNE